MSFSRLMLLPALGCMVATPANAFVTLGHGRLVGTAAARADYDSNIYVSNRQVEDYVGTLTGEVRYVRDSGILTFDGGIGATVLGFVDHSELNSFDPSLDARMAFAPSDKTEGRGNLIFRRSSVGNEVVNARTESNDLLLDGTFQHLTTEKLGFRLTGAYAFSNFLTPGYSDTHHLTFGAHGVHVYSPKLKLLAGVTRVEAWSDSEIAGRRSVSGRDWRYTVGAEGEFAPKVTGSASVGYAHREFTTAGFDDTGSMYLSARIHWVAAEKTSFSAVVNRDFGVTAADQSARNLNFQFLANHQFTEKVNFEGMAGVDWSDYTGAFGVGSRRDDGYSLRGRVNYLLREDATFDVSLGYRRNNSTIAISDYDRVNIGAGVSLRF